MANTFVVIKKYICLLNVEKRFCRDAAKLELNQEKVNALEEIFDFAKEYSTFANHSSISDVGDRLRYYLSEGNLSFQKTAEHFGISKSVVASNVHYASKSFSTLIADQISLITEAEDIEEVQEALSEFRNIRKAVVNPYDLEIPDKLLKSLTRRKKHMIGGAGNAKNKPSIIIP